LGLISIGIGLLLVQDDPCETTDRIGQIRNAAGNFITPNTESISAAAKGDMPADTRTMITNSAAPDAYPISCFLVRKALFCFMDKN